MQLLENFEHRYDGEGDGPDRKKYLLPDYKGQSSLDARPK